MEYIVMSTIHQVGPQQGPDTSDTGPRAGQPAALSGDGALGAGAGRGGTGAAPRNTAPDTSNFRYQPLRWGIDSLYLSYPGALDPERDRELRQLKALAQGPEHDAAKAQIVLADQLFTVHDKSSGLFAFSLSNNRYQIRLAAASAKNKVPMAYVRISSGYLSHVTPREAAQQLDAILRPLGDVTAPKVSRVDLFVDFASDLDMESWGRQAWVTKAHDIDQYAQQGTFTGWSIGKGGALMARLYHKLLEIQRSDKTYLLDLWRRVGWDGEMPVWRLEFQFKREILVQLGLDGLSSVLGALDGLWDYASTQWLKLTQPSATDATRSRWPLHPLWLDLAAVDWGDEGGPLTRTFPDSHAPSLDYLGDRALALAASLASVQGLTDFDAAVEQLARQAFNALGHRYGLSGLTLEQGFAELVESNNRRYLLRHNAPPEPVTPPDPRWRNPYYRAKEGL